MNFKAIRTPLILAAGVAIGISLATSQGVLAKKEEAHALPVEDLQTFVEIMNRVKADYVEDVSDKELLENAIRGMLAGLDPHSAYLDDEEFRASTGATSGKFGGLGIEVQLQNGWIRVVAPIDDTPAAKAGIQPGDFIIKIEETPVKGMTLTEAVKQMRGEPGTKLTVTMVRDGTAAPFELTLERAIISVSSVRGRILEPGIGYIRVSTFSSSTGDSLITEVNKLKQEADGELKGLVLDLRNNPGGVLNAAVEVSDAFLHKGAIVSIKGRETGNGRDFNATPGDLLDGRPMVVLVNGGSASASEIVAGALQDHHRGVLVGTKTFGKGSVQTIMPLRNEAAIKLTTARYYTPNGRSIQAEGIDPDVTVAAVTVTRNDRAVNPAQVSEAQLRNRLEATVGEETDGAAGNNDADDNASETLVERDYALYESLNLLKGLIIVGKRG